jgi:hypothetical protein
MLSLATLFGTLNLCFHLKPALNLSNADLADYPSTSFNDYMFWLHQLPIIKEWGL